MSAYDPVLAERVRNQLSSHSQVAETTMVGGGLGFMVGGRLCCGVRGDGLTVRVGPDARTDALAEPHVRPHLVGQRQTTAFVIVGLDGCRTDAMLRSWLDRALAFVRTLP